MKEENKQRIGMTVLHITIALLTEITVWMLGFICREYITKPSLWLGVVFTAIALLIAGNLILDSVFRNKLKKLRVAESHAILDERRERIRGDLSGERKRLYAACVLTAIYTVLLAILSLVLVFFAGARGKAGDFFSVISIYLIYGFISRILVKRSKPDFSLALSRQDYPELYRLADEAAAELGDSRCVHIFTYHAAGAQECNASVTVHGNDISVLLSVTLLCILNRDELKQVLLHEFAHLEGGELQREQGYYQLLHFLAGSDDSTLGVWTSFALRFPLSYLVYEGQFYMLFSSLHKETTADSLAAASGHRLSQASASAKISSHELYTFEQEPYANCYIWEDVPQHYVSNKIQAFRCALREKGDLWKSILEREIPSLSATHPTFRQRWEALGCCPYDLTPAETESAFAQECWKAAEREDIDMAAQTENYKKGREEFYLKPMSRIEAFEAESRMWAPEDLRPLIEDYFHLGMPEKAESLCDQIIRDYDSPFATAFASFWKGKLLLYRYDADGIGYIYRAMEANSNYVREGLNLIGFYCCKNGLQELLDEYRQRAPAFMQQAVDRSSGEISARANLSEETLPEGWLERIVAYAVDVGGESLCGIYLVHEQLESKIGRSAFVLRFIENSDPDAIDDTYEKIFVLLDDWPVDWDFSLYVYDSTMEKGLQKVANCCVYKKI